MCVRVLRVSGMPFGVQIWVDDQPGVFTLYVDEGLITEQGAEALERVLTVTAQTWQRNDEVLVPRLLRAITG